VALSTSKRHAWQGSNIKKCETIRATCASSIQSHNHISVAVHRDCFILKKWASPDESAELATTILAIHAASDPFPWLIAGIMCLYIQLFTYSRSSVCKIQQGYIVMFFTKRGREGREGGGVAKPVPPRWTAVHIGVGDLRERRLGKSKCA